MLLEKKLLNLIFIKYNETRAKAIPLEESRGRGKEGAKRPFEVAKAYAKVRKKVR